MIIDLKRCSKCTAEKSRCLFPRNRRTKDGVASWCKDCLNANSRKYHALSRGYRIERCRRWRDANPPAPDARALAVERTRIWCKANPERASILRKNRKHTRRARERGMAASELREWLISQRKVCHWCGDKCAAYEIDHRVSLAKRGRHERRNLVISCRACNRRKGARDPVEFARSLGKLV